MSMRRERECPGRSPSPLPRGEVFVGASPAKLLASSRPPPVPTPVNAKNPPTSFPLVLPVNPFPRKPHSEQPPSPGSSITNSSPAVSPASSAASGTGVSVSTSVKREQSAHADFAKSNTNSAREASSLRDRERPLSQRRSLATNTREPSTFSDTCGTSKSQKLAAAERPKSESAPLKKANATSTVSLTQAAANNAAASSGAVALSQAASAAASAPPNVSNASMVRDYDIFEEDDFTDRFDSFRTSFDRDAALDEYLVLSRRYDSAVKMRREVRDALPKKRKVIGEALWERLYSDVSQQFHNREGEEQAVPLRKMLSSAEAGSRFGNKDRAAAKPGFRQQVRPKAQKLTTTPSAASLATDEFLEFQGVSRSRQQVKPKETPKVIGFCKKILRLFSPKRRT